MEPPRRINVVENNSAGKIWRSGERETAERSSCCNCCAETARLANKQARRSYFGQLSKQRGVLLACLLVNCLYIVNLVVAVVSDRPLVFSELISGI